jgi:hypothetical protein
MYRSNLIKALVCAAVLGSSLPAQALTFKALLDGPSEAPPNDSKGKGVAFVEYDASVNTLEFNVEFWDLTGDTTVAHIHAPTAAANAGTIGVAVHAPSLDSFPAGVKAGTYSHTFDLSQASSFSAGFINNFGGGTVDGARNALISALTDGKAYFNVHTTYRSPGEIRGFFATAVPDSAATASLMFLGLVGLGIVGRRVAAL